MTEMRPGASNKGSHLATSATSSVFLWTLTTQPGFFKLVHVHSLDLLYNRTHILESSVKFYRQHLASLQVSCGLNQLVVSTSA